MANKLSFNCFDGRDFLSIKKTIITEKIDNWKLPFLIKNSHQNNKLAFKRATPEKMKVNKACRTSWNPNIEKLTSSHEVIC